MSEDFRQEHIDWVHLDEISGGDRVFALELLNEFINAAWESLPLVVKGIEEGDLQSLKGEIHTLKGSGRTVGAAAFGNLCESFEQVVSSGDLESYQGCFDRMEKELGLLANYVASLMNSEAA